MAPQSRGKSTTETPVSPRKRNALNPPPRFDSLTDFPSPSSIISDQRTPTGTVRALSDNNDDNREILSMSPLASPSNDSAYNASVEEDTPDPTERNMTLSDEDEVNDFDFSFSGDNQSTTSSQSGSEAGDESKNLVPTTSLDSENGNNGEKDRFPPLTTSISASRPSSGLYSNAYHPHSLSSYPSSSSLSHSYGYSNHFAPPFYNRPPNPLPPSPSLTSLLGLPLGSTRTPFSLTTSTTAASTRPSTPTNLSDSEFPDGDTTSIISSTAATDPNNPDSLLTSSARRAPPSGLPRASPRVPTYEYYGFGVYVGSWVSFLLYLIWSYTPSPILHQMGIHYYPNRWWSLAIPSMLVMTIVYIYVALLSWNVEVLTLSMEKLECMVDEAANIAVVDGEGRLLRPARRTLSTPHSNNIGTASNGTAMGTITSTSVVASPITTTINGNGNTAAHPNRKNSTHQYQNHLDSHNQVPTVSVSGTAGASGIGDIKWRNVWSEGTDAVMDIPIGGVCEVLYGEGRDDD